MNEMHVLLIGMLVVSVLQIILLLRPRQERIIKETEYIRPSEQVGMVDASDEIWNFYRRAYEYGALVKDVAEAVQFFGDQWHVIEVRADGRMLIACTTAPYGYGEIRDGETAVLDVGDDYESGSDSADTREPVQEYAGALPA